MAAGSTACAAGGALSVPVQAAVNQAESYATAYPDMLLTHVAGKLNSLAEHWDQQREQIRTVAEVTARNRYARQKFREMIHGFPERTPLSSRVITTHQRDGYRIENVMFQSRPDFWVTASLYIPANAKSPCPGVISPCGHYQLARMDPEYQCAYVNMVKAGLAVLAYDPIGQGERRQYWNPETDTTEVAAAPVFEHSMAGQLLLLMGEDLTGYRVWDGMRAIDYLETRPEVDRNKIGCAGHSGGGTLTLFISAIDERVQCAVVSEGGTSSRWPMHLRPESRVGPADVEQNYFPGAKYGVDMPDLHIAIAPRPLLAQVEEYHVGFNHAADQIRKRYAQLGVEDRFSTDQANDPHAWTPKLRLSATRWLSRWLLGTAGPDREPEITIERPQTLYCTPNGSLRYSQTGDTIFSLILKKQESLPPERQLSTAEMTMELANLLRYKPVEAPLSPRVLVTTPRKGYSVEKLEFLSEPGIFIPTWVFLPDRKASQYPTWLFFNDAGKQSDGMEFGLYEKLACQGQMVIACDARGIGETRPPHPPSGDWPTDFKQLFDVETAISYMAWYADESLTGMRVRDVIGGVSYALGRGDVDRKRFRVAGKGAGALWVLFAAILDERITDLTMERGLISYRGLTRSDRYTQPTGIFVLDILKHFDLPQLAAGLAGRKLTIAGSVDEMKRPVDAKTVKRTYAITDAAFQPGGSEGRFRLVQSSGDLYEAS